MPSIIRNTLAIILFLTISIQCVDSSQAQGFSVKIDNGFGYPLYIYVWPRSEGTWLKPIPYLPRSGESIVWLPMASDYFFVARDAAGNDDSLGWFDVKTIVQRVPDAQLVIDGKYEQRVETKTYEITKLVPERKVRTTREWWNGRWVLVNRLYTILKPVLETRTKEVKVLAPVLALKVRYQGQDMTVDEFLSATNSPRESSEER